MPGYLLVKGQFHLFYRGKAGTVPSQPDGDSMWFKPDNPRILKPDGKRLAKFNGGGFVQLRFEAIDALETHYHGAAQMDSPGKAARDFVLKAAGFKRVAFGSGKGLGVKSAEPHPVPGHILTHGLDDHGRPVSFVFAGKTPQPDGGRAWIVEPDLARSINAGLVKACLVYPMFYLSLPPDLRGPFEDWFKRAQVAKKGVWAEDVTTRRWCLAGESRNTTSHTKSPSPVSTTASSVNSPM